MKKYYAIVILAIWVASCRKEYNAPIPNTAWDLFNSPAAKALPSYSRPKLEGVYQLNEGAAMFGEFTALKGSYTAHGTDTTYYLSLFFGKDIAYFIGEGKQLDSSILFNGYWRKMAGTETGKMRLIITKEGGAAALLKDDALNSPGHIIITGTFGSGENPPDQPIRLQYARPLYNAKPLEIVVHRGGGQTADLLPASENSTQIIQLASQFGATGIEVDVRLTKDGVPILYHDASLSERLIQKNGMVGSVENYTYAQLNTLVRLIRNGEHIPTLREALETVVYQTPLRYVWMDTKFHGALQPIVDMQAEYMQKAAAIGRSLEITIGIPDKEVLDQFLTLPNYQTIPSVCELDPQYVTAANSRIWGPRWTLGLQNDAVAAMHAQGRKVFVWTLDIPQNIYDYMTQGGFDGILTDYPSIVAYYYYVHP